MAPLLSIAIPAYNEGARLPAFLAKLGDVLTAQPAPEMELIISDDGSRAADAGSYAKALEELNARLAAAQVPHRANLVTAPRNAGKAAAIRLAWSNASAKSEWLAFLDADGAVSAGELVRLAGMLPTTPFDVLAASRIKMAGRVITRSAFRHLQGRVFATAVEVLFGLGLYDTQCGLKFFRGVRLRPLLGRLAERGWLLDVELLACLKAAGASVREEPIDWADVGDSKVIPGLDAVRMFAGLVRLRARLRRAPE